MAIKRVLLAVTLAAALTVGLWAATPAATLAQADVTYPCSFANSRPVASFASAFAYSTADLVLLLSQGFICVPEAVATNGVRFTCTLARASLHNTSAGMATAIVRAGGQCLPVGVPRRSPV